MLYYLLLLHWMGDFVFQWRYIADNKSHNQLVLLMHGLIYGTIITAGLFYVMPDKVPISVFVMFLAFNVGIHIITDAVTSKMTAFFYKKGWMHSFFTVIGLDQMLHVATLLLSIQVFLDRYLSKECLYG